MVIGSTIAGHSALATMTPLRSRCPLMRPDVRMRFREKGCQGLPAVGVGTARSPKSRQTERSESPARILPAASRITAASSGIEAEAKEGRAVVALKLLALIGVENLLDVDRIGPITAEAVIGAAATKQATQGVIQAAEVALFGDEITAEWRAELARPDPPTPESGR